MEKRSVVCAFLLGVLVLAPPPCFCWVEEAHLTSGAILKEMLLPDEVNRLESLLRLMVDDYPDTSDIVSATKWAIDLETTPKPGESRARRRYDSFSLFNPFRYLRRTLMASKIKFHHLDKHLPDPATGSGEAGKSIINSLRTFVGGLDTSTISHMEEKWTKKRLLNETADQKIAEDFVEYLSDFMIYQVPRDLGPYLDKNPQLLRKKNLSFTRVSINLHLRLLLHIFVNIHQPLCTTDAFGPAFPRGNSFGRRMIVRLPGNPSEMSLFDLWETAGGMFAQQGSEYQKNAISDKANALMKKYPEGSFSKQQLDLDLNDDLMRTVANESHLIAKKVAYAKDEISFSITEDASIPVAVSKKYLQTVSDTSKERLVLGSYRLARLLKKLLPLLPYPAENCMTEKARNIWESIRDSSETQKGAKSLG